MSVRKGRGCFSTLFMHVSGCTDDLDAMCEGRRGNRLITCCHAFATSCLTYGEAVAFSRDEGDLWFINRITGSAGKVMQAKELKFTLMHSHRHAAVACKPRQPFSCSEVACKRRLFAFSRSSCRVGLRVRAEAKERERKRENQQLKG